MKDSPETPASVGCIAVVPSPTGAQTIWRDSSIGRHGQRRGLGTPIDKGKVGVQNSLPDILNHGLVVVFVGINPGLSAAAAGHRFVAPSNRFWRALHLAGFSPTLIPAEQDQLLPQYGCGLTSVIARPTRRAAELTRTELAGAGDVLCKKIEKYGPKWIAFLGKGAYSAIMARRDVAWGAQPKAFGGARVWVLPDPSA